MEVDRWGSRARAGSVIVSVHDVADGPLFGRVQPDREDGAFVFALSVRSRDEHHLGGAGRPRGEDLCVARLGVDPQYLPRHVRDRLSPFLLAVRSGYGDSRTAGETWGRPMCPRWMRSIE